MYGHPYNNYKEPPKQSPHQENRKRIEALEEQVKRLQNQINDIARIQRNGMHYSI